MEAELGRREPLFSNRALRALIIPLVIERFLEMAVGMADTVMVASVGEGAVSAISLVDNVNNLVIYVLAALASGGAVVISQYLGRSDVRNARLAANQLLYTTVTVSAVLTLIGLLTRGPLLNAIFGALEPDVMAQAQTYFWLSVVSYPFIAIFNSAASVQRSMGISRISMIVSLGMNLLNICGNAILIYGFNMGVAGAATSSLISRIFAAVVMLILVRSRNNTVYISNILRLRINWPMIKGVLRIGIPSGVENGLFHLGRVATQSLISTFGTSVIAANAAASRITNLAQVYGAAMGISLITVIGQCVGAGEYAQAKYYTKKLLGEVYLVHGVVLSAVFLFAPQLSGMFNLSAAAQELSVLMLRTFCIASVMVNPLSFPFASVLRAAGDVRYPMIVSIVSMGLVRVAGSYLLANTFGMGALGVWFAMYADWFVRAVAFSIRYKSGKWRSKAVI